MNPIIKQDPGSPRWSVGNRSSGPSVEYLGEKRVDGELFV